MIVNKRIDIVRVRISRDNIMALIGIFAKRGGDLTVTLSMSKNEKEEYNGISEFDNIKSRLENKHVSQINLLYYSNDYELGVPKLKARVELTHGNTKYANTNYVTLEGMESEVDRTQQEIENESKNWKKQINSRNLVAIFLSPVLSIGAGVLVLILYPNSLIPFIFAILGVWLLTSEPINDKMETLYPNIEFEMGPEHMRIEVNRRRQLYLLVTLVILPFIIALIVLAV